MRNDNSFDTAWTTGTIIAIVAGSVGSFLVCIGVTIALICIIKRMKRVNHIRAQGMVIRPIQPYSSFQSWPNQYPLHVSSYPTMAPPYTSTAPAYF